MQNPHIDANCSRIYWSSWKFQNITFKAIKYSLRQNCICPELNGYVRYMPLRKAEMLLFAALRLNWFIISLFSDQHKLLSIVLLLSPAWTCDTLQTEAVILISQRFLCQDHSNTCLLHCYSIQKRARLAHWRFQAFTHDRIFTRHWKHEQ